MKLFCLNVIDQWGRSFAAPIVTDKVQWADPLEVCKKCLEPSHRYRTGPYGITFEPGSSKISDFSLPGAYRSFIVTDRVKQAFEDAGLTGFVPWLAKVNPPVQRKKNVRPIAPYPPPFPLWDIYVPERVHVIVNRSSVIYKGDCPVCLRKQFTTTDPWQDHYFVVDPSTWSGCDFMYPEEVNTLFVTERVIDVIKRNDFTNIESRLVGEIATK
jgi:hypothetical protein